MAGQELTVDGYGSTGHENEFQYHNSQDLFIATLTWYTRKYQIESTKVKESLSEYKNNQPAEMSNLVTTFTES